MAEEVAAEPEQQTTLKDFGDLAEAFDKAFPATAEKKESESPQPTEAPASTPSLTPATTPAATPEETSAPTTTTPVADELPDFLTGKKPEEVAKPTEPEFELPPPKGKESSNMTMFREKFDLVKSKARAREQQLLTQLDELKKAPPTAPDAEATIKNLEAKVQEMSGALERTAIEFHPAFKAEFTDRREALMNAARQILTDARADTKQWDRAMSFTGEARTDALEEIYENLPRSVSSRLGAADFEISSLDARKEAYLSDRKGLQERLQQESLRQQREAWQQHEKNTLELMGAAEKDLIERMGIEVYKTSDKPEHAKWNESVAKMKADAKKILLETEDPSVMARAAYLAPAAIQYRYLYHTMRDRWIAAEERLKAIEKSEPTADTRGETAPSGDDKLSFADAVARSVFSK